MFFASEVTRSTLTDGPSSIAYLVTVGPRLNPVTCASTSNWSRPMVSASTMAPLARGRALGAVPGLSSADGGSVELDELELVSVGCVPARPDLGAPRELAPLLPAAGWSAARAPAPNHGLRP